MNFNNVFAALKAVGAKEESDTLFYLLLNEPLEEVIAITQELMEDGVIPS